MKENEAIEVLKECLPIYDNLHDKIKYSLTGEEIKWLNKLEIIWNNPLEPHLEETLLEKAGMSIYKFAFLGGYIKQVEEKEARETALIQ